MADQRDGGIAWTDETWNPLRARSKATGKLGWHCEKVSEACRNCYAEGMNKRLGTGLDYKPGNLDKVEIFLDEKMLLAPLRWKKPRKIFVCSTTDLFGDWVKDEWLDRIFAVMALCPQHTFQVLTKRPKRMLEYILSRPHDSVYPKMAVLFHKPAVPEIGAGPLHIRVDWPLPNMWLGVTAEDQEAADARIPDLLATPAAVRFVSVEPMLGPVDLTWIAEPNDDADGVIDALIGRNWIDGMGRGIAYTPYRPGHENQKLTREIVEIRASKLDWVIAGGESGPHARPSHPDWERSIRDQCAAAGVAYFRKQAGEWLHESQDDGQISGGIYKFHVWPDGTNSYRVGKCRAGRLLDGVEHNEFPKVT